MDDWTYVILGWAATYVAVAIWFYASRAPKNIENSKSEND